MFAPEKPGTFGPPPGKSFAFPNNGSAPFPAGRNRARKATKGQAVTKGDDTAELYDRATETALLRGLMHAPARSVLELAETLETADFCAEDVRTLYRSTVDAARRLGDAGEQDAPMSPDRVRADLQRAGQLSESVSGVLLEATSAQFPAPVWTDVQGLAAAVIGLRARRAIEVTGQAMQDVAYRSDEEIGRELNRLLPPLVALARRAGLEVQPWV